MQKLVICAVPGVNENRVFDSQQDSGAHLIMGNRLPLRIDTDAQQTGSSYYELRLYKAEYDKKLFAPGELKLHFAVTSEGRPAGGLAARLRDEFVQQECMVDLFGICDGVEAVRAGVDDRVWIAQNYYVGGVSIDAGGKGQSCVLKCFSYDRHLAREKYCDVFTGKKFGEEIFKPILEGKTGIKKRPQMNFSVDRMLMMAYNGAKKKRDGYGDENAGSFGHNTELIQPYLIQYNESAYDFLCRVAHKCGEFLYFEDGKLNLGLPENTRQFLVTGDADKKVTLNFTPFCSYGDISADEENCVKKFSSDYFDENKVSEGRYFDMQYTSDAQNGPSGDADDGNNNYIEPKSTLGEWIGYKAMSTVFTCDDFLSGVTTAAITAAWDLLFSAKLLPWKVKKLDKDLGYSTKTGNGTNGSSNDIIEDLCNHFYALMEELESMEEKHKVTMDFTSCLHKMSLADVIDIKDGIYDDYVITRMYGSFSYSEYSDGVGAKETYSHKAEGVPVLANSPDARGIINPIIDNLLRIVVPPACGIANNLSEQLIDAEVTDNADPAKLNRVKISYSFKSSNSSPWIPVLVPYAGTKDSGGFTMTPDKGERVVVLIKSDTAKYVIGSMYTKSNSPDLGYKDNVPATYKVGRKMRNIASGNGHAITFLDKPDNSLLFSKIPGFRSVLSSMRLHGKDNWMTKVGNIKGGGIILSDGSCLCTVELNADKQAIDIHSDFGTVGISAFTGITVNAPNGDITIKGKNVSIEAGNNLSLKAGTNIKKEGDWKKTVGLSMGSALAGVATSALSSLAGVDLSKAFDVSYLRSIYEIIIRPVEGSLSIQSNRNVLVTAGKGKVTIPSSLLSNQSVFKNGGMIEFSSEAAVLEGAAVALQNTIRKSLDNVSSFVKYLKEQRLSLKSMSDAITGDYLKINKKYITKGYGTLENFSKHFLAVTPDGINALDMKDLINEDGRGVDEVKKWYECYKKQIETFRKNLIDYNDDWVNFKTLNGNLKKTAGIQLIRGTDFNTKDGALSSALIESSTTSETKLKRLVIVKILMESGLVKIIKAPDGAVNRNLGNPNDYENAEILFVENKKETLKPYLTDPQNYPWWELCDAVVVVVKEEKKKGKWEKFFDGGEIGNSFGGNVLGGFTDAFGAGNYDNATGRWKPVPSWMKLCNVGGVDGPRGWSEISANGNILVSNSSGTSLSLKNNATGWQHHLNLTDTTSLAQFIKDLNL